MQNSPLTDFDYFVLRRHGNIDFANIHILLNFNPMLITGVNITSIDKEEDYPVAV